MVESSLLAASRARMMSWYICVKGGDEGNHHCGGHPVLVCSEVHTCMVAAPP